MTKLKEIAKDVMEKGMSLKEKVERRLVTQDGYDLSALNEKELRYFRMMYPQSGVLFLTSKPGIAKSAMQRSIAKKITKVEIFRNSDGEIDFNRSGKMIGRSLFYIDLRLAMLDETDVGLFPDKKEMLVLNQDQEEVLQAFLDHIVPKWAFYANNPNTLPKSDPNDNLPYCGTLIHFEELNRAPLSVRNAALQILLERCIGFEFKFNSNVFMVSTGNLGEEDGTDVEEFDTALNGRLIHLKHDLLYTEWVKYWAKDNIQGIILDFLEAHPENYYISAKADSDKSYASPRTWHFLSDYITKNYGFNASPQTWIRDIQSIAHSYIGAVSASFMRYVSDALKLTIFDIMDRYPELKQKRVKIERSKKSELMKDLRKQDFKSLKLNQIENIKLFLLDGADDEVTTFLLYALDDLYDWNEDASVDKKENDFIIGFLKDKRFVKYHETMLAHIEGSDVDKNI